METKKICIICGEDKILSAYYKHKAMADGHLNKCKTCTKKQSKERQTKLRQDPLWVDKERKRGRDKYHRLDYKEKHKPSPEYKKATIKRYQEKYPEKRLAKNKTCHLKPTIKGNHLHHWSYNREHYKDVIEIGEKEHNISHRFMIYDQERMMYRTIDNILLDSKDNHVGYILTILNQECGDMKYFEHKNNESIVQILKK